VSIAAAAARVSEIQQLLNLQPPTPGGASSAFAAELTSASAAQGANGMAPPATATTAAAGTSTLPAGTPYAAEITAAATRNGVEPALLAALVKQESGFNPTAGSPAGAQGLTQLMPATAASLGVTDSHDPAQALEGGAKYLRQQLDRFGGDVARALAAYNAGPGAVERFGGVPPYAETQNYVRNVQAFAAELRAGGATAPMVPAAAAPIVSANPNVNGIV